MSETIGSQRLLQATVRHSAEFIDPLIRHELGLPDYAEVSWRSPIAKDNFKEYRDGEALRKLDVQFRDRLRERE